MTALGQENMFGKQRGRFDEEMARRVQRSLPDQCLSTFMAMDESGREEFAAAVNRIFEKHNGPDKWRVSK